MSATAGLLYRVTIFGESHAAAIGCVIDGLPPGFQLNIEQIEAAMRRRAPNRSAASTKRRETDEFEILCGLLNGRCTGTPLAMIIRNRDQRSTDYDLLHSLMRPGHADYAGRIKYRGFGDVRGGGHFSGRITAPLVFAGAAARQILTAHGISVGAHIAEVAGIADQPFESFTAGELTASENSELPVLDPAQGRLMMEAVASAAADRDSVGGWIECAASGVPAGVGEPFFGSLESEISRMMFSIPGIKAIEFGDGLAMTGWRGSMANDSPIFVDGAVRFCTNHSGGINGGISNGMPIRFRVAVRPTASIAKEQQTVNMDKKVNATLTLGGRHDASIVPRACEVVKQAFCCVLLDMLMQAEAEGAAGDE